MERIFSQFFSNAMNYALYDEESRYLKEVFRCRKTPQELCHKLRQYQQTIAPAPRLEDFIRHYFKPCLESCPYYIPNDICIPVVIYGIRQLGEIVQCEKLHAMVLFQITEGRYPNSMEMLLLDASNRLNNVVDHINYNVQMNMGQMNMGQMNMGQMNMGQRHEEPVPEEKLDGQRYPSYVLKNKIDQDCCMCQEELKVNQHIITLPCMHSFHSKCDECIGIEKWLETSNLCPLCKKEN